MAMFLGDAPNIALVAGTAKTVLLASTPAGTFLKLTELSISCDAVSTGTLKVELLEGTITGGTTATAPNRSRGNIDAQAVAAGVTLTSYSAEPTYTKLTNNDALAVRTYVIPTPFAPLVIEYPLGREYSVPVSSVLAVRLTSTTVAPNSYTGIGWDES